jgi:hypothetical protein
MAEDPMLRRYHRRIREWHESGRSDEWIAEVLVTSPGAIRAFRLRNGIRRSNPERPAEEPER